MRVGSGLSPVNQVQKLANFGTNQVNVVARDHFEYVSLGTLE